MSKSVQHVETKSRPHHLDGESPEHRQRGTQSCEEGYEWKDAGERLGEDLTAVFKFTLTLTWSLCTSKE